MNSDLNDSISLTAVLTNNSTMNVSLSNGTNLTGLLNIGGGITGVIEDLQDVSSIISEDTVIQYDTTLDNSSSYPSYTDSYDIIPRTEDQTLNTKNKVLHDDVLVESIPYFQTSNEYGDTIYIG